MWVLQGLMAVLDAIRGLFHEVAELALQLVALAALAVALWWLLRPLVSLADKVVERPWWRQRFGGRFTGGDLVGMSFAGLVILGPVVLALALYAVGVLPAR
ncbi:hypothetical protein [Ancylobacter sp. SL191]|uniref:hypothetical protein n=1 Tax=Ancylobacter sp. SL191 TaxID=2995166 RepID=UPI00226F4F26|nr:hypothetical protein [Ancylobacter sp. SL191]WAC26318.1 hypothetical protein OU996_15030 [Ancylobacter sp. SL191]